ncbi:MAG TPA: hypothetical protein VHX38_33965 [Pseudonocardiaceae bacterium]|nr:hypothetical protein [Pseudonocardiaceae bacterium]
MTAQPAGAEAGADQPDTSRYSEKTLRRIRHARVTRDTIVALGGVFFTVAWFAFPRPPYTLNDPLERLTIPVAVVFGIAALVRGVMMPLGWDRTWSRTMRYTCSIIFVLVGLYFMLFSAVQSGHLEVVGTGVTTDCKFFPGIASVHAGGNPEWACDIDVHWTDGTTTAENVSAPTEIVDGQHIEYAKPFIGHLFPFGNQPVAAWQEVWFYLLAGVVMLLQSLFALGVLIFGTTPPMKPVAQVGGPAENRPANLDGQ